MKGIYRMIRGSYPAMVTPFKNNEVDYNAVEKLLDFHLKNKTDGLVILGTTGEASSLANDEKESLLRFCVQRLQGKISVVAGTGSNNLNQTIAATQKAEQLGLDYALVVTPYYNKPNQEGLYLFYRELIKKTNIPIILYNVPSRTGCNISAETMIRLANEFPNQMVSIKEASGDLAKATKIIRDTPDTFSLVSGEDALNFPLMCIGSRGTISVTGNAVPLAMHQMIRYALDKNYDKALQIHQLLVELNEVMFCDTNPIPVKVALAHLGLIEVEYRLPLCKTTDDKVSKITSVFDEFNNCFKKIGDS
jgi:4-hydroxy-tetrahydrodipicolinate synthase